ncbi:hypothetical protein BDZ45DRAFT_787414 [Acephala macrosclerotiorum]|nr:hypothetical protein BDZ45DRAFT_787414 [Acephala macrosclerotiorum]
MSSKASKPRVPCTIRECSTTFSRKADLYRHLAEVHGDAKKCPVKDCTYMNTKRESRLKAHMMSAHPELYKPIELEVSFAEAQTTEAALTYSDHADGSESTQNYIKKSPSVASSLDKPDGGHPLAEDSIFSTQKHMPPENNILLGQNTQRIVEDGVSIPPDGKTRISWTCRCGHELCDDFIELKPGAAKRYRDSREGEALLAQRQVGIEENVPCMSTTSNHDTNRGTYRGRIQTYRPEPISSQLGATFMCDLAVFCVMGPLTILLSYQLFAATHGDHGTKMAWLRPFAYAIGPSANYISLRMVILRFGWDKSTLLWFARWIRSFGQGPGIIPPRDEVSMSGEHTISEEVTWTALPDVSPATHRLGLAQSTNSLAHQPINIYPLANGSNTPSSSLTNVRQSHLQHESTPYSSQAIASLHRGLQFFKGLFQVKFVRFDAYPCDVVDVRKVDDIPPPGHVEYIYFPAPPDLIPPVGDKHMMHLFQNPDCAENEGICASRFPKKLKRKLKSDGGVNPGWGLHFVEGWDWRKISIVIIQDAFAIASYMIGFATVTVGTLQAVLLM